MVDITPRLRTVIRTAANHGLAGTLATYGFAHYLPFYKRTPKLDTDIAPKLNNAFRELGGIYAHFAHFLSTRPDLTRHSAHFTPTLPTHPALPGDYLKKHIEDAFNKPFASLYRHIDPRPLASTPLHQTHKARTTSGDPVTVTVTRLPDTFIQDLTILRFLSHKLHKHYPGSLAIFDAYEKHLNKTLDLRNDAQRTTNQVYDTHSNNRVLTQAYVDNPYEAFK